MLAVFDVDKMVKTIILTAALSGLRKSELMGLRWQDFNGTQLNVRKTIWNGIPGEPKTKASKAPIPVVKWLADALEVHKLHAGVLAQPGLPIFQAGNGKPLNLDNLAHRVVTPAIEKCVKCRKPEADHKPEGHMFELDKTLAWHGWHAFRRGLATNLHELGVDDKTIQAILRHSNISVTQNTYIKSVSKSQVNAMDTLSEELEKIETCNELATTEQGRVN